MTANKLRPRYRGVILPPEHGSWGMIAEPLLLGLLISPTWVSLTISLFSFSLFLLRVPFLRLWKARRMPSPDPQRRLVFIFTAGGGVVAFVTFVASCRLADPFIWLWPFVGAAPMAFGTLVYQDRGKTRHLFPELLAAVAIGAPMSSILLSNDFSWTVALALWGLIACKSVSCIVFVRYQIRRSLQRPAGRGMMFVIHGLLLIPATLLSIYGGLPSITLWVLPLLGIRMGLFAGLPVRSARQVGWIEVGITFVFVICVGLSF
ncbi:YwiC-like family protein [Kiritimatiellaeota bacterium B1221]|nr:YwiC-like family protein [Kiritimatiellaeota bacterium B1221]